MPVSLRRGATGALVSALALTGLVACSDDAEDADLVVYSGRSEDLIGPIIEQFEEESGLVIDVRYGDTPTQTATLLEEGEDTPADVFLSQDAGALGALDGAGLLLPLPAEITDAVLPDFTSTDGSWVGLTGRARVIVYDSESLSEDEVPGTVAELTDPEWNGRVAFPPTNASFQSFITGFRVAEGDDAARAWLEGMVDNDVQTYENNLDTLNAVNDGGIELGLINHYYMAQLADEVGEENLRAKLKFMDAGDPGALVNVTGGAILSDDPDGLALLEYLVSAEGQQYFVDETTEYSVVEGIATPEGLPALTDLQGPIEDLSELADLETTLQMIQEAGLS